MRKWTRSRLLSAGCLAAVGAATGFGLPALYSQEAEGLPLSQKLTYAEWAVPLSDEDGVGELAVCFSAENPPSDQFIADMMAALEVAGRLPPVFDPHGQDPSKQLGDSEDGAVIDPADLANPDFYGGAVPEYYLSSRWSGSQGDPRALTWSFAPDGLSIPNGIGEGTAPNNLFAQMDSKFAAQGGRATWVDRFQKSFDRWAAISGLSYTRITVGGNDWDDGAAWGSSGSGTRGDIRICMKPIDGNGGVLAYNFFPSGGGDMHLDSGDNWGLSTNQHRFLRNTVMHEHGHGIGMQHSCSNNAAFLMEPFLSTSFDGPQHDDIRGAQRHYGDAQEKDDTAGTARHLGTLTFGATLSTACNLPAPTTGTNPTNTSACSIDANGESDWWSFTVNAAATLNATVSPVGFTYQNAAQASNGSCPTTGTTNSLQMANLAFDIVNTNGVTVLATANSAPIGQSESVSNVALPGPGTYYLRVYESDSPSQSQLYNFTLLANSGQTLRTLDVTCDDAPVNVTVTPNDNNGQGNGTTDFSRLYPDGANVTLTAPMMPNPGLGFMHWQLDGVNQGGGNVLNVAMTANRTANIVYGLLDQVTIISSPNSGALVTVSPADFGGNTNGTTPFVRTYFTGSAVSLTAPATLAGDNFDHWVVGGSPQPQGQATVVVNLNGWITVEAVYAPSSVPCPEDCSGDGQRDQGDLAQLLSCYNVGDCCDINGDGITDQADLAALLAVYNTACP